MDTSLPRLPGLVAIVTGASSGIGRATCLALAQAGVRVVAVGRHAGRLLAVANEVREAGAEALALQCDVRREPDMRHMAQCTLERFGRIDILVNAAGLLRPAGADLNPLARLSTAEWDEVLDTNLRGTFLACRSVLPAMIAAGRGDIVNLSSRSGLRGLALDAPYCASKFGVIGLSQALADEVREQGVRVQVIAPGKFDTEVLSQTGPLPQPRGLPPAQRVAHAIRWMLAMPSDARLVSPVIEPAVLPGGPGWGQGTPLGRTTTVKERSMEVSTSPDVPPMRGKVVLITGGAGGIGLATAQAVAAEGATVVVADVDPARIDAAVTQIQQAVEVPCLGLTIDVRREQDHERMVRSSLERFGRIDALIACAGILRKRGTPPKLLVDVDPQEWDEVMDINLRGVFLSNRAVLPTMIAQRSGTIINLSSVQGLQGRAYDGPYCASKFGVIGLTQAVAEEVRSFGVKVIPLMPAAVATAMWEQNLPAPMPPEAIAPQRVAELIVFLLKQPADTVLVGPVIAPVGARRRRTASQKEAGAA